MNIEFTQPADVERIAKESGQPMSAVCFNAGISHSTFTRWKNGSEPKLVTVRRLLFAAETGRHYSEMETNA